MVKQTIQIYCRIKPTKQTTAIYELEDDDDVGQPIVTFTVPRDLADGFINNKKENYKFRFDKIFTQKTKQDEIFDNVARPVIDNVLSGFNGTIFAYGQTGSGKTFTITGGAERYVDRGIIPRTLSYIFHQFTKMASSSHSLHVSYLEIYNESGYDLLDPNHEASKLEDLPKVSLLEDYDGNIHLKNLSLHQASNEEEALNLLFLGDTNRMIAETPMNQASTRSHCIFSIHVTSRGTESATIRRSKLHLVDLAGSERVGKTGVGGTLLKEAKYINLSLHFLEQVIIALSEKSRSHIPYRNSMMTSVLRDSLGGNCMTSMVATCSVEKKNVDESISTCRFAQRVALIKNDAILNEELDPKLLIEKLKREIQQLKDELALATGQQYNGELTEEDKGRLADLVQSYLKDKDVEAILPVGADMRKINFCFRLLKDHYMNNTGEVEMLRDQENTEKLSVQSCPTMRLEHQNYLSTTSELQKLKDLILQRDNEINILVSMLKKEKKRVADVSKPAASPPRVTRNALLNSLQETARQVENSTPLEEVSPILARAESKQSNAFVDDLPQKYKAKLSMGRQEAFEIFKRDYSDSSTIEENKNGLKMRYMDAKKLGQQVNQAREAINTIKAKIEKIKSKKSATNQSTPTEESEEMILRESLDQEKLNYKHAFNQLKLLKTEIEHMQHLLEKSKLRMQKDFEMWWAKQSELLAKQPQVKEVKRAWKTPPLTPPEVQASTPKIPPVARKKYSSSSEKYSVNIESESDTLLSSSRQSSSGSIVSQERPSSKIRLTGDMKTDEDILAFMKARQELLRKNKSKR